VADSFFCRGGVSGWVEFKQTKANKIASLTAEQVAWHMRLSRKGGRSFFAVRRGEELLLVRGERADLLKRGGLSSSSALSWQRPWPWSEIGNSLTT
jgi:hypothetical protein